MGQIAHFKVTLNGQTSSTDYGQCDIDASSKQFSIGSSANGTYQPVLNGKDEFWGFSVDATGKVTCDFTNQNGLPKLTLGGKIYDGLSGTFTKDANQHVTGGSGSLTRDSTLGTATSDSWQAGATQGEGEEPEPHHHHHHERHHHHEAKA